MFNYDTGVSEKYLKARKSGVIGIGNYIPVRVSVEAPNGTEDGILYVPGHSVDKKFNGHRKHIKETGRKFIEQNMDRGYF